MQDYVNQSIVDDRNMLQSAILKSSKGDFNKVDPMVEHIKKKYAAQQQKRDENVSENANNNNDWKQRLEDIKKRALKSDFQQSSNTLQQSLGNPNSFKSKIDIK